MVRKDTKTVSLARAPVNHNRFFILARAKTRLLDQQKDYPLPEPVINLVHGSHTYPLLTLKSHSLWQGKAKSRKTTVLALMVASYIKHIPSFESIRFIRGTPGKVLFCDCEQGVAYGALTQKLVLEMAAMEVNSMLMYLDLREDSPQERLENIEALLKDDPEIRLIILDGLVDLMTDFMDPREGQELITQIGQWSSKYNIHLAGILHQNKNDSNARAHVGSIAGQKGEMEISLQKDTDNPMLTTVTCNMSRGLAFPTFAVCREMDSLPYIDQEWEKTVKANTHKNKRQETAEAVLGGQKSLTYSQLVEKIMEHCPNLKTERGAEMKIKTMTDNKEIFLNGGYYRLVTEEPKSTEK